MLRIGREVNPEPHGVLLSATADDVKSAQNRERIRSIERRGTLAAWNDFIGFGVSKIFGLSGLIIGGIGYVVPSFSPIVVNKPAWVAGAGLALLTGKNVLALISKLERSMK